MRNSDRSKGAGEGALLLVGPILAALARQNAAVSDNGHMLAGEFFLQLSDQTLLNPEEELVSSWK